MNLDSASKKVLITGIDSFTGVYLKEYLLECGYEVYGTTSKECDVTQKDDIKKILLNTSPDFIIHLAGISFAAHKNSQIYYHVNTIGALNLLDALLELNLHPQKVILASSATVYGNQGREILDESLLPQPANHYGASKYAMEVLAKNYFDKLPILITRPFNYTGIGQAEHFLIPKIVKHFKENSKIIELGNLHVKREFNSVYDIVKLYAKLLTCKEDSLVVNLCSQSPVSLLEVVDTMQTMANYEIKIKVNPAFVRENEIKTLCGSVKKLFSIISPIEFIPLKQTLQKMYDA